MTITKASIQDNLDLAKQLWIKGITPEQSMVWLKGNSYVVNGIKYQATAVAQGISMLVDINSAIKSGKLSATKAKGLHIKG